MRTLKAGVVAIGPDLSKFAVTRSTLDGVHQIHYLIIIWAKLYTINIHVMRGSVLQPHLGGEVGRRDTDAKVNKYQVAEYMLSYHDNHRNNIENPNKVQYSLFEIVQLRRLNVYKYGPKLHLHPRVSIIASDRLLCIPGRVKCSLLVCHLLLIREQKFTSSQNKHL